MQEKMAGATKKHLVYMNFAVGTFFKERSKVAKMFENAPYCKVSQPKDLESYLKDTAEAKFVLSPRGNGTDCHRTWEALLMGAYPIVRTSYLDPMYENLPVVIVEEWEEVTEEFLNQKYEEFQSRTFQLEKAYIDYWLQEIEFYKNHL